MNEESVKVLREAVVLNPGGNPASCALMRLSNHRPGVSLRLDEVAMSVGFTRHEGYGIMDGWDEASGRSHGAFRYDYEGFSTIAMVGAGLIREDSREHAEYVAGRALGAAMFETVRVLKS